MSEYAIIFQVLAAVLALFFIFLTYMNTKTWRWPHVTMMFFVFAATVAFAFYAALTLKARMAWIKLHHDLEKQVTSTDEQLKRVLFGDPKDTKTPSVATLREDLGRAIIDRGRVWRGCIPTVFTPQTGLATVSTSPRPDPNLPPPPVKKNRITAKTILHAFREAPTQEGRILPAFYIGEFEVTAATDDSVTMTATMPLAPDQIAAAGSLGVTWSLYESCPVDGHEWFAGLDQNALQAAIPQTQGVPPTEYQKLIQSYLRDGKQAETTDPPDNVWVEVKFLKERTEKVNAPTAMTSFEAGATEQLFPFNSEGQALLERLRRKAEPNKQEETVTFGPKPEQITSAILDQQTAEAWIASGDCEKVRVIYRRRLNDYELKFHSIYGRTLEINGRLRQLDIDDKTTIATMAKANQQATLVEELKTKLTDDLTKAQFEQTQIDAYLKAVEAQLAARRTRLSELYGSNHALAAELTKQNEVLTKEIERRTREATAKRRP
jgi:hypothetical protein